MGTDSGGHERQDGTRTGPNRLSSMRAIANRVSELPLLNDRLAYETLGYDESCSRKTIIRWQICELPCQRVRHGVSTLEFVAVPNAKDHRIVEPMPQSIAGS